MRIETNPNTETASIDDVYYASGADLKDKIIVLMQYGVDPLLLSASTWSLVRTSQCQAIN
jgi:hypothetical protein